MMTIDGAGSRMLSWEEILLEARFQNVKWLGLKNVSRVNLQA